MVERGRGDNIQERLKDVDGRIYFINDIGNQ